MKWNRECVMMAMNGNDIIVSYHFIKSLQVVCDLQLTSIDLDYWYMTVILEVYFLNSLYRIIAIIELYRIIALRWRHRGPSQYKTDFPRYGDSHVKDKSVARPSYL